MNRHAAWPWTFVLWAALTCSCVDAERSNPLEGGSNDLFLPKVLEPSGGEQWFPGMARDIRWRPATQIRDSVVTIQLRCPGLSPELLTIVENTPNTGVYHWTVTDTPSPACRIRIVGSKGFSESEDSFRINPDPVLEPLELEGKQPAALREFVAFKARTGDNDDVWLYNRRTRALKRLTVNPGFDGEPDWFKPNGNVLAYTSERDGQKDIWMMSLSELRPVRVTTGGGEDPAWQPSFFEFPSLAFKRHASFLTHIFSVTLDIPTPVIVPLPDSVGASPPVQLTSFTAGRRSIMDIQALDWALSENENVILYATPTLLWRIDLTPGVRSDVRLFVVNPSLTPSNPAFSVSGARVAFSVAGDLWVKPVAGGEEIQLTYDDAEDDFPDWATETEIVFQRRRTPADPWKLWTVQAPQ